MKIKLIKIEKPEDAKNESLVEIGKPYIGTFIGYPKIDECFYMDRGHGKMFRTSRVQEILSLTTFKTLNSIYKIEDVVSDHDKKGLSNNE